MELLRVAEKQGVSRLLSVREPLDGSGIFPAPNWEAIWGRYASTLRMRLVQIHSGCCPENFLQEGLPGILDWKRGNLALWGKGNAPMDFTTSHDKARYLAQIATRDFVAPHIRIAGSSLNIWECKDMFEGICGRELRVVQQGSLCDLDLEIARRQELSPESPSEWSALLQWRYLLRNPHGSLNLLNHQFPEIRPKPLHHALRAYRQTLVT
jgi:hypothetical protein